MIRREDGSWLYMLPSVVDDIDMGVTHVVRGEDHVTNTGLQLQMFEALGAPPPAFAHEALLVGSEGKLAKRLGSLGVEAMREAGIEPLALVAKLARIGTSLPVEPVADPAPLIESFDFATFGRAPARFDMDELEALNARIVHQLAVRRGRGRGCPRAWPRRTGRRSGPTSGTSPRPPTGGRSCTAMSSSGARRRGSRLPRRGRRGRGGDRLGANRPGRSWSRASRRASGRAGKALFQPLRRALTGRDSGPEMAALLPLIGRDEAIARLRAAAG